VRVPRNVRAWVSLIFLASLAPASVAAQTMPPAGEAEIPKVTFAGGGAFTAMRADCQTCEESFPYRQTGGVFGAVRYRAGARMEVGGEVLWVPVKTFAGDVIRTTHIDAVAQFWPWGTKGFFLKGGAGVAFVRNWVDLPDVDSVTSKALSVEIGGGWAFRRSSRFGVEMFATQHAAALGDITTSTVDVQDVLGNFWSLGVAITIR
jgi:hypothetical protein